MTLPVSPSDFAALAERVRVLETETATALQQVIDRMTGLVKIVGDVDTRVHAIEMEGLEAAQEAVTECLSALESSICSCRDCLMHREKARHGKAADRSDDFPTLGHDPIPAWQRAKVGDRVEWSIGSLIGIGTVTFIADPHNGCRLCLGIHGWVDNLDVLTVLPPEPAAPVQDAREQALDIMANFLIESAAEDLAAKLADAGLLAAAPQPLSIDWNTALDTYYLTARAPNGTASDGVMAVLKLIPGLKVEA